MRQSKQCRREYRDARANSCRVSKALFASANTLTSGPPTLKTKAASTRRAVSRCKAREAKLYPCHAISHCGIASSDVQPSGPAGHCGLARSVTFDLSLKRWFLSQLRFRTTWTYFTWQLVTTTSFQLAPRFCPLIVHCDDQVFPMPEAGEHDARQVCTDQEEQTVGQRTVQPLHPRHAQEIHLLSAPSRSSMSLSRSSIKATTIAPPAGLWPT